jgi:NAD(P)-dependent dehydrogenase (short-subunit alcohol dehydrogenase family)
MLKQKYGVIVNTSSVGALKPVTGFCAYNSSKSGLIALTRTAALEVAASGIRGTSEHTRATFVERCDCPESVGGWQ